MVKRKIQGLGNKDTPFITFENKISAIKFNKVSIVFLQPWLLQRDNDRELKKVLRKYLESEEVRSCRDLSITEFPSYLGVFLQKGARRVLR